MLESSWYLKSREKKGGGEWMSKEGGEIGMSMGRDGVTEAGHTVMELL